MMKKYAEVWSVQAQQFDVSVVIVSYNTKDLLMECLESVFAESPNLALQVIVVDNASDDASVDLVRTEFCNVIAIENSRNMGFAAATNLGITASSGKYVLLLNPDTVVLDRAVERMFSFMESDSRLGACGCRLVYPDGRHQPSAFPFPTLLGAIHQYSALFERAPFLARQLVADWTDDRPWQTRTSGYCTGACLMVARDCIDQVGLLDESFFLYSEEVDWCKRMWLSGRPVMYFADAVVIHHLGASQTGSGQVKRRLRNLESVLLYLRKWHGPRYAATYHALVRICSLYRYGRRNWSRLQTYEDNDFLTEETEFYWKVLTGQTSAST